MLSPDIAHVPQAKPFLAAAAQFAGGQDTPRAFLERCLDALAIWEPKIGAFVHTQSRWRARCRRCVVHAVA